MASPSLSAIAQMNSAGLRIEWQKLFGSIPANRLSRDLMHRVVANRLQETALGSNANKIKKKLFGYRDQIIKTGSVKIATDIQIKPGTKLLREWNAETHSVLVLDNGFEYRGERFKSLSKIAKHITGAHWSGPRFFGLKKQQTINTGATNG